MLLREALSRWLAVAVARCPVDVKVEFDSVRSVTLKLETKLSITTA